jgi:hypothetical protein
MLGEPRRAEQLPTQRAELSRRTLEVFVHELVDDRISDGAETVQALVVE